MKRFYLLITLSALYLLHTACPGSTKDNDELDVPYIITDFKDITVTDESGLILSKDSSDWILDALWSAKEAALFDVMSVYKFCPIANNQEVVPAYPNPNNGRFFMGLRGMQGYRVTLHLVDRNLTSLRRFDSFTIAQNQPSLFFALNLQDINASDTLRLYYRIQREDGCELRGHGDLLLR
ncbi:MAG TPA: hypothetical protein PKD70_00850 [Saprospiraceae bacterium]|nr:hypothetical protein [Saprospiraceae bacterium]HMP12394.1 hypothetical protein [Saprospiraceae bacterium]